MKTALWVSVLAALLAAGCDDGDDAIERPGMAAPDPVGGEADADVTYGGAVHALMQAHCASCHAEGGAGPFALDSYARVKAMAEPALAAIESGRMPPWQPDPACRHYRHERLMPDAAKAVFAEWVEAGMPEGPRVNAEQPQTADLGEPDVRAAPSEPYLPDEDAPDDYRCFPLDHTFARDTYVRGSRVVPGDRATVHHVLVFAVSPADVERLEQMDAADPGPGYTCFGGSGLGNAGPVAAWVPGAQPNIAAEGIMQFFPAGGRLVMQVHYNVLAADPSPDLTTVEIFEWDEPQPMVVDTRPQADVSIEIPPGDAESTHSRDFVHRGRAPMTVIAVAPHMHVLGARIKVELIREGGERECLVDIPEWDFNWQQTYAFREGEQVVLQPGDRFRLTCVYDNSPENQPVVNGERLPPREVTWGEGTLDEMCLNYITVLAPFEPDAVRCEGADDCQATCPGDDFQCAMECYSGDSDCGQCALRSVLGRGGCARSACLNVLGAAQSCLIECVTESVGTGGSYFDCMKARCPEQLDEVVGCMDPVMATGACDEGLLACVGD